MPDRGQYNPMQGKIKEAQAMKFQIEVEQEVDGRWIDSVTFAYA